MWIPALSTLLMVGGIILVLCALPPVRSAAGDLFDHFERLLFGSPKPVAAEAGQPETAQAAVRREIEDFDLSIFEN